jgi:hypothetical protein
MAKDKFHTAVRRALEKEGWQITHAPLPFGYGGVNFGEAIEAWILWNDIAD